MAHVSDRPQAKVFKGEFMNAPLGYIGDTPAQRLIPAQPIVRLEKVSKTFPGRDGQPVTALRETDLAVPQGSILGVIGRSGAGKSTLIRLVNGLEKPSSGKVIVDGADIAALPEAALRHARRSIGMIFQHFNLLSSRTAAQNIALPLEVAGFDKAVIRPSSPVARSSASALPARSPPSPRFCSPTKQLRLSTRRPHGRSSTCSGASMTNSASPSCSSPTRWR
ncbi:MAG: methionine transporter ATP-binding protein [Microvirga sp.]|nr:methionine transporter ATP-binding protein [Microvirga sp.]